MYILRNDAFKEDWLKIGQSRRSGSARAAELNVEAGTGIPKHFVCVFEAQVDDCGRAEKAVFQRLREYRTGRQEYFKVDLDLAKRVIYEECGKLNDVSLSSGTKNANAASEINQRTPVISHTAPSRSPYSFTRQANMQTETPEKKTPARSSQSRCCSRVSDAKKRNQ